ncbi:C-C chemokine receptor type 2-like [Micropterus dolomieu]|uniref:C-C chemokine receptor type 2-like n=1 Tax=Micropterus dolomieu TaxID=147949 RepID=UPI001E8DF105|nr:C-C chemokine receptor type 2-like [Micropterus dolomieu]XP_045899832.1 C-C chemokine receptor type 2-like [Micropterus dolomieu]
MSDYDANTTAISYNYLSYYDDMGIGDFSPCNYDHVGNFGRVFLPTLYSLVFILGFIGNGLVVCVLVKHRNQTNLTDICLFNLALSDLFFVLTLPFYSHYSVVSEWTFGGFMCSFIAGLHNIGFFSSIFFMVVMTLDRYVVIMHAHTVARYRTLRKGIALTVLVWMLSLSVSLPAFIFTKITNESGVVRCAYLPENDGWETYNLFATNMLGLVIPLLVMVVCYSRIIPTLVNMRTAKKHRVVKLILTIVVVFFLFWAPYNICLFLRFLKSKGKLLLDCKKEGQLMVSVTVTETFAYTHCCLNPIIYAFVGQKFMKRAVHLLSKWVPGSHFKDLSDSSFRKSSVMSRSSEVTSTFIK